jgi:hypothetical protein
MMDEIKENPEDFEFYQVLAARKDDINQSPVFTKIFKLPKNTIDWVIELACCGIAFRDGHIDPNTHVLHKARWDPVKVAWVGLRLDKT